ncbi:ribonuclease T [Aquisalimonas sp.]|uniref:ribonuclease T n=1 Tax=Aquisalimonas sp. TaxID=1872621 RepID=UPI0025BD28B4|nr:ribonuclease T [Aquisalimonas sp.]
MSEHEPSTAAPGTRIARRFRSFLPVVVDVETGGLNPQTDALLQLAAVILRMDDQGRLYRAETHALHVRAFDGANIDPKSLEINGIRPDHPLRIAYGEQDALGRVFKPIRQEVRDTGCTRAILVGHNATFDLNFLNAAVERCGIRRNPFHPFGSFDTATLAGLAFGQTVLAKALKAADLGWDGDEAHSAVYDAEKTADLFCEIVNLWDTHIGIPG